MSDFCIANHHEFKELKAIHNLAYVPVKIINIANHHEFKELKAIHNVGCADLHWLTIANHHEFKELKAIHNFKYAGEKARELRIITNLKN